MQRPYLLFLLATVLFCPLAHSAEPIPLRAGPLHMVFDVDNVFLRHVTVGPHEVLRGINAPIRNQFWGTIRPRIRKLDVEDNGDSFRLRFEALCQEGDIDFRWRGTLTGNRKGEVEFTFRGKAHSTFKRNRIGFCVLHGPGASGQPWQIETVTGKTSEGRFPIHISPHQPAKLLKAIEHEVAPGITARVEFEGDIFEMEDQRNWTDASFKTYCTPLDIPYPVEVNKGTRISQTVRFQVRGDLPPYEPSHGERVALKLREERFPLPRLGVQVSEDAMTLTDDQVNRLRALHLDHLRVDLTLSGDAFARRLEQAAAQAKALGLSLHVGILLGENPDFAGLIRAVGKSRPQITMWLVIQGRPADFNVAREKLAAIKGNARIGIGWNSNFVDLNRNRPDDPGLEVVAYAINPQIHAFDNDSIMETLPIHGDTARSARQFIGDRPLVASPITLMPQRGRRVAGQWPADADVRQPSLFTAAFTLGSVKYLAEAGVHSATYFDTVGSKGIMDSDATGERPPMFASRPGAVFDVYHVLRDIGDYAGGMVQHMEVSDPLKAVGLVLRKPGHMRILVANLTDERLSVGIHGLGRGENVFTLNATKARKAMKDPETLRRPAGQTVMLELPIELEAYGIARIDRVTD